MAMALTGFAGPAAAQEADPLGDLAIPGITSYAPATRTVPLVDQASAGELLLDAKLTQDGGSITEGLKWRVYGSTPRIGETTLPLVATAEGGGARFLLEPGDYLIHAAFGRAGATTRIVVGREPRAETLVLSAGGLMLNASLPDAIITRPEALSFDIYSMGATPGDLSLVLPDVPASQLVRLPAGTYHIVSQYGDFNAEIRADLRVEAGKTTEATILHRATHVTFSLVREPGGNPLADTAWSVLTPTGEIIVEHAGPSPDAILAEGTYTVVAENRERVYQQDVTIQAGNDVEVEVLTSATLVE